MLRLQPPLVTAAAVRPAQKCQASATPNRPSASIHLVVTLEIAIIFITSVVLGVFFVVFGVRGGESIPAFRTAVPFWGQTTQILSNVSPKRDRGPKRVKNTPDVPSTSCADALWAAPKKNKDKRIRIRTHVL